MYKRMMKKRARTSLFELLQKYHRIMPQIKKTRERTITQYKIANRLTS
jgi:hypothetical protein